MSEKNILPIILCGGSGSRLWPLSRSSYPKQYLSMDKKSNLSFLQNTANRLKHLKSANNPIVVCSEEHRFITAEQLREIKIVPSSIILEPSRKNTAPAIALAALKAVEKGDDQILLILPSDHKINKEIEFIKAINNAKQYAKEGYLVTFGIVPSSAETGYGYIQAALEPISETNKAYKVEKFIEKPKINLAEKLIKDNKYSWNSGIYMFKASKIIKELKQYSPKIYFYCKESFEKKSGDLYFERIEKESFQKCQDISIDKAVMEKTNSSIIIPLDIGWSDIGGWKSFWENSKKDINGNVLIGNAYVHESKDCLINSSKRLTVALGLKNIIAVETSDAILVADKNCSEKVKQLVCDLKKINKTEGEVHTKIYRPWGNFTSIDKGSIWKIKKIEVNPGASLSLQSHEHRAEHWIVVSGTAKVVIGSRELLLNANESCFVPMKTKHRLSNPFKEILIIVEVQSGEYLEEDDIVRYADKYGR